MGRSVYIELGSNMKRKLALILGNGSYARYLFKNLHETANDEYEVRIISLIPLKESIFEEREIDFVCDLLKINKTLDYLKEEGITHVVLGGDVRLPGAMINPRNLPKSSKSVFYMAAFIRGGISSAMEKLQRDLKSLEIEAVCANELLPALKLKKDILPASNSEINEAELIQYRNLVERTLKELENQPRRSVRQALAFDGDEMVKVETNGTDSMLSSLSEKNKGGKRRVVLKLCPPSFNSKFDSPVIALKTIEGATNAKVDVFIFDDVNGIIYEQAEVVKKCITSGLKLIRLSSLMTASSSMAQACDL